MRKITPVQFLTLLILIAFSRPVCGQIQSKELVSKFFPDPGIEINTPGFSKAEGFMTYDDMMNFLEPLAQKHSDFMRIGFCGESMSGKKIPVVYLENKSKNSKIKIWMQGGLHGNEPAGTESLLMFIENLVNTGNIDSILNNVSFAFIPMANIDGYEKQKRYNDNGADLNRDQVTLEQTESVFLKKAFTDFSPAVAIDFHEFRPFRKELESFSSEKICISQDVLFLPSGNLNIPAQLRALTNDVYLKDVAAALSNHELTSNMYFVPNTRKNGVNFLQMGGDSPRSSSSSFGLTNAVSILFEIRGINLGKDSYKRRVYSGYLVASSILETSLKNKNKVLKTVESAIHETKKGKTPIVLSSVPAEYQADVNFLDVENAKYFPLKVEIEDANKQSSVSQRQRPKAYILLPGNASIVQKLQILGLKTDTLRSDVTLNVEVFKINPDTTNPQIRKEAIYQISKKKMLFPKGSFVISTAQKNTNIAVSTLEPEMENGFVIYKMIKANSAGEIPVYRCMSKVKSTILNK